MTIDEHGVNILARNALGNLLAEPARPVVRHYVPKRDAVCGASDGYTTDDRSGGVTCEDCRAWIAAERERFDVGLLRRLAVRPVEIRKVMREARQRLVGAGLAKVVGASVVITDAGKARVKESA